MKKLQITIPEPCHENWAKMTTVEKGKFCGACQKNVYDFTKSTDREIINTFEKDKKLCGRFLNTQLNRDLIIPKERKSIWLASAFFGMLSLYNAKMTAQEKPKTEQTDFKQSEATNNNINTNEWKTITGLVSDSSGPLPGAIVVVKGTTRGVQTNFDGTYSIRAKEDEKLVYSFMGMNDVVKTVGSSTVINAILKDSSHMSTGLIITVDYNNEPRKLPYIERAYRAVETWFEY